MERAVNAVRVQLFLAIYAYTRYSVVAERVGRDVCG